MPRVKNPYGYKSKSRIKISVKKANNKKKLPLMEEATVVK